jgi:hypothetical protein
MQDRLGAAIDTLPPDQRARTVAWLALVVSDALPKDALFPPSLRAFCWAFISEVLGEDPMGDPERIRKAVRRFVAEHPPAPRAVNTLRTLLREWSADGQPPALSEAAYLAIGQELRNLRPVRSAGGVDSSPLGVRFGLTSQKERKR